MTFTQALKIDAHGAKNGRRTARALYLQLAAQGDAGGSSRLTDFIRHWREKQGKLISARAFVPLVFELGETFRFDFSEGRSVVGGICYRMQVSHLKLRQSRP